MRSRTSCIVWVVESSKSEKQDEVVESEKQDESESESESKSESPEYHALLES